jgi:tRNA threonylcarbamoyladenosine biosynthesis protein TsaB
LISIPTLLAMTVGAKKIIETPGYYCPMIDARRMEVYYTVFDRELNPVLPVEAKVIDESFLNTLPGTIVYFGDGASKCRTVLNDPRFIFAESFASARFMGEPADRKYSAAEFENVGLFEPFYLKEFNAGKSKL